MSDQSQFAPLEALTGAERRRQARRAARAQVSKESRREGTRSADQLGNFGYPLGLKYEPTETAVVVARHMRRLSKAASFCRIIQVVRWSVDQQTGVVTYHRRNLRRRIAYMANQSHGFITVNDGPSAARDVARLLTPITQTPPSKPKPPTDWRAVSQLAG